MFSVCSVLLFRAGWFSTQPLTLIWSNPFETLMMMNDNCILRDYIGEIINTMILMMSKNSTLLILYTPFPKASLNYLQVCLNWMYYFSFWSNEIFKGQTEVCATRLTFKAESLPCYYSIYMAVPTRAWI